MVTRRLRPLPLLLGILGIAGLAAAQPAAGAKPLSVDDIIRLLEAEVGNSVIQRQVESTETRLDLSVDQLILLSAAGADDQLLAYLQERRAIPDPSSVADAASGPVAVDDSGDGEVGIRLIRTHTVSGQEVIVITNLDGDGHRLVADTGSGKAGVITSSDRAPVAASSTRGMFVPRGTGTEEFDLVLPPRIEVTLRADEGADGEEELDERLDELETRLDDMAGREESAEREVGEGWFPRHPINDHREIQVLPYALWGVPVTVPVAFKAEEFRIIRNGPYLSFTGAAAAGYDPFKPLERCVPGQACSLAQRQLYGNQAFLPPR